MVSKLRRVIHWLWLPRLSIFLSLAKVHLDGLLKGEAKFLKGRQIRNSLRVQQAQLFRFLYTRLLVHEENHDDFLVRFEGLVTFGATTASPVVATREAHSSRASSIVVTISREVASIIIVVVWGTLAEETIVECGSAL